MPRSVPTPPAGAVARRLHLTLVGLAGLFLVLVLSADARAATVLGAPSTLPAGASAVVRVDAGDRSKACSLSAKSGRTTLGPFAYSIDKPIVSIAWTVPKKARTLTWTISLRCASSTKKLKSAGAIKRKVAIKGKKHGIRRLFNPGSVRFTTGARGSTYSGLAEPTYPEGGKGGVDCSPGVLDASTYCTGYCTWYAYSQRPAESLKQLGNAATWYERAQARGIPEVAPLAVELGGGGPVISERLRA